MQKKWLIIILIIIAIAFLAKTTGLTGLGILLKLGDQGGKVNYQFSGINTFIQCWDADPSNQPTIKSVCHAQYYKDNQLVGMNSIDYCDDKTQVVDFYCAQDFSCQTIAQKCSPGLVCKDGSCKKEGFSIKNIRLENLINKFPNLFKN